MTTLFAWKIPGTTNGYIIYLRDPSIPKEVKAFFRRHPRLPTRVKMRIKDDKRVLNTARKQAVIGLLDAEARSVDYDFDKLLRKARKT